MRTPIAVFASGKGSNLAAILEEEKRPDCPYHVCLVFSDRADARALRIAKDAGVERVHHLDPKRFDSRSSFDLACAALVEEAGCEWIALAGYMRLLSAAFVDRFRWRILNVHPALLPAFPGAHAVRDALAYGVKVTGVTIHLVDEGIDTGPILAQEPCPVFEDDSEQTLHERLHAIEHRLYPQTIARAIDPGFELVGRRVIWRK